MASTLKVLGQSNPVAATLTDAYTVPASTSTVISSITVCNRSATATTYRVSVAVNGAADSDKQYIAYDTDVEGNQTQTITLGPTLGEADVVRVYATLATLSFNIFGSEVS